MPKFHRGHQNVTIWILPAQARILDEAAARSRQSKVRFMNQAILTALRAAQSDLATQWCEAEIEHELGKVAARQSRLG